MKTTTAAKVMLPIVAVTGVTAACKLQEEIKIDWDFYALGKKVIVNDKRNNPSESLKDLGIVGATGCKFEQIAVQMGGITEPLLTPVNTGLAVGIVIEIVDGSIGSSGDEYETVSPNKVRLGIDDVLNGATDTGSNIVNGIVDVGNGVFNAKNAKIADPMLANLSELFGPNYKNMLEQAGYVLREKTPAEVSAELQKAKKEDADSIEMVAMATKVKNKYTQQILRRGQKVI